VLAFASGAFFIVFAAVEEILKKVLAFAKHLTIQIMPSFG